MQQVHPDLSIVAMQSQHDSIMALHLGSPLVQVTVTPSLVMSHLHMPMVMLQQQTIMPFMVMQKLHMPPAIMVQRFCTMPAAVASSHTQVTFMPPLQRSILNLQRGTIIQLVIVGMDEGMPMPGVPMPDIPIPVRSIIMALVIGETPFLAGLPRRRTPIEMTRAPRPEARVEEVELWPRRPAQAAQTTRVGTPYHNSGRLARKSFKQI
jgi:hypothetical protein